MPLIGPGLVGGDNLCARRLHVTDLGLERLEDRGRPPRSAGTTEAATWSFGEGASPEGLVRLRPLLTFER